MRKLDCARSVRHHCNDDDPAVPPGAVDALKGMDDDCNGVADDGLPNVDGFDLARLGRAFGRCGLTGAYSRTVDFDQSDCIDGQDRATLAAYFGQTVP